MYLKNLFLGICLAGNSLVSAHYIISELIIGGKPQGPGKCMRLPHSSSKATDPLYDLTSTDIACNTAGDTPVARICPIIAGQSIGFQWLGYPNGKPEGNEGYVEHPGPAAVYMKKVDDVTQATASGPGWFKIWEDGLVNGKWANERIVSNGGIMTVDIPLDIEKGEYLIRGEHIGLHNVGRQGGGDDTKAQIFVGCGQLIVNSLGSSKPKNTVSIPGYIDATDKAITTSLDTIGNGGYTVPGPKVYESTGNVKPPQEMPKEPGYSGCTMECANWCAKPLGSYKNQQECTSLNAKCWSQTTDCYNSDPLTGSDGCKKYEAMCDELQGTCNSCGDSCSGSF